MNTKFILSSSKKILRLFQVFQLSLTQTSFPDYSRFTKLWTTVFTFVYVLNWIPVLMEYNQLGIQCLVEWFLKQ